MQDRKIVLVLDDDPGMLKAVQRLLRQHAYEPILFSSAQALKNHSDIEKAVCVILDINLPDGSGIELRDDLKAAGVPVPVIFITGNENPRSARQPWPPDAWPSHQAISAQELIEPLKVASAGG
jgi:FixJ family two-component response regulator